jgi:hypothetical protein
MDLTLEQMFCIISPRWFHTVYRIGGQVVNGLWVRNEPRNKSWKWPLLIFTAVLDLVRWLGANCLRLLMLSLLLHTFLPDFPSSILFWVSAVSLKEE